jgi:hypothetical protein
VDRRLVRLPARPEHERRGRVQERPRDQVGRRRCQRRARRSPLGTTRRARCRSANRPRAPRGPRPPDHPRRARNASPSGAPRRGGGSGRGAPIPDRSGRRCRSWPTPPRTRRDRRRRGAARPTRRPPSAAAYLPPRTRTRARRCDLRQVSAPPARCRLAGRDGLRVPSAPASRGRLEDIPRGRG